MRKFNCFTWIVAAIFVCLVSATATKAQKVSPTPTPKPMPVATKPKPFSTDRIAVPAKAVEFYDQGKAFWKEIEINKAIEAFTRAIDVHPNYVDALAERGSIYFLIRQFSLAVADLDKVLAAQPKNVRCLYYRGSALTELAIAKREDDDDQRSAADLAQRALADFNKAIEISPREYLYYNGRGQLLLEFEYFKEASADLEKSLSIEPNFVAHTYLGLAKHYLNDENAMAEVEKAIKLYPKFGEAFYARAIINRDNGNVKNAISDLNEALKLDNNNEKYYNTRGMLYFRAQDGNAAVADFTRAIKEKPDFAMAYFNRAVTYKSFPYSVSSSDDVIEKLRLQRSKRLEDLSSAIKYRPSFDAAFVERGLIYSTDMRNKSTPDAETLSRLKLALSDFENAVKINPNNADAFNFRGSVYDNLGKKDLALADYSTAIKLDPTLATAYMGRMAIYCEQGKKELSIADEKKVRELGLATINMCNLGGK